MFVHVWHSLAEFPAAAMHVLCTCDIYFIGYQTFVDTGLRLNAILVLDADNRGSK